MFQLPGSNSGHKSLCTAAEVSPLSQLSSHRPCRKSQVCTTRNYYKDLSEHCCSALPIFSCLASTKIASQVFPPQELQQCHATTCCWCCAAASYAKPKMQSCSFNQQLIDYNSHKVSHLISTMPDKNTEKGWLPRDASVKLPNNI